MRGRLNGVLLFGALALLVAACAPPKDVTPAEIAPPTGLTVVAADAEVTITWIASTSEDVVGYNILQGTSASDLTLVHSSDATTLTHTLTGLTNGTEYFFALEAEGPEGRTSARTAVVSATPEAGLVPVEPPTNLLAVPGDAEVELSWTASATADAAEYHIYQGTSAADLTLVNSVNATTLAHTLTGLTNGTEYHFAVQTEGSDGRMSARSSIVTATPGVFTTCVFGESRIGQCTFGP